MASAEHRSKSHDTVEKAAATSEQPMSWAELGPKEGKYASIRQILGRRPTAAELAMYSVMWSEHYSYKSSKIHLKQFGSKFTPEIREHLLVGMGENVGVVDIGDGRAVMFKVELHNHPSFIEPYQGVTTGVGGIARGIVSMGTRSIAVMDRLCFGDVDHMDTARVVHSVVAGVGGYGDRLGLPNIGGEIELDASHQENPFVNALCVGVLRHGDIHLANASGEGSKVVPFGARTDGDSIGGVSILTFEAFEGGTPAKRPSVQVGDLLMEKVLIECCLEPFVGGLVLGIQDLGVVGISCVTSELAPNGDGGMHVDLGNVLLCDPMLTAGEILVSESQERVVAAVAPGRFDAFMDVAGKWKVEAVVIGTVNASGRLTIDHHRHRIVDVDPRSVAYEGPTYERPYARPQWQDAFNADDADGLSRPGSPAELCEHILRVLTDPNQAGAGWVIDQYDRLVRGNAAFSQPGDVGVIRVDEETGRGIATSADVNRRYTKLDSYKGVRQVLAEACRNVCTVGVKPLAVIDCPSFGSPKDPNATWQLAQTITGSADACREMGVFVTGRNVSLYNSHGKEKGRVDPSINPTSVVGVPGVMDDVRTAVSSGWQEDGLAVMLLGRTRDELDGSIWARVIRGHLGGRPSKADLQAKMVLGRVLLVLYDADTGDLGPVLAAVHDVSNGGLVQVFVNIFVRAGVSVSADLRDLTSREGIDNFTASLSETQARVVLAIPKGYLDLVLRAAEAEGAAVMCLGITGGGLLAIQLAAEWWAATDGVEWSTEASVDVSARADAAGGAVASYVVDSQLGPETGDLAGSPDEVPVFDVAEVAATSDAVLRSPFD